MSWWRFAGQYVPQIGQRFTAITIVVSTFLAIVLCARLDVRIGDWLLTSQTTQAPSEMGIVIVAIDEQTLAALPYRSPVDRGFLAELIGHIDRGAPRAIGVDILLDQASETAKDTELLRTIRGANSPTVLAYATATDGLTEKQVKFLNEALTGLRSGHVAISRDAFDGSVRHWPSPDNFSNRIPLFASAIAQAATGKSKISSDRGGTPAGRIVFRTAHDGGAFAFPTYPAHAAKLLPANWFKDKIVLIGGTLPNIDQHQTPFTTSQGISAGSIYGVKIHAHMIDQLLHGHYITTTGFVPRLVICLLLAGLIAYAFSAFKTLTSRLSCVGALLGGAIILTLVLYRTLALELPIATLVAAIILASSAFVIRDWHSDWSERRFIQQAFGQYVSPALVEKIAANHDALKLGGEQRDVTYIFTDLEGFTSLSESLPPDRISEVLNAYLDGMCDLFIAHGATIDKIIGDAVVGLYGAPDDQPDHADQAVSLALAIDEFAEDFRKSQTTGDFALGVTRVGLHHGPAVVGNFGGRRFFDYTAIGDTVNTAARLEGANKYLGTRVCVSKALADKASNHTFRPIGDIILKGKDEPVPCLEPIRPGSSEQTYRDQYSTAYGLLETTAEDAKSAFMAIHEAYPDDGLVNMHLARLKAGARGIRIELESK